MKELIKIQINTDGKKAVSAREMYIGLGLAIATWNRWSLKNIERNPFAVEGKDWISFNTMLSNSKRGNFAKDYILTLDFAKKLCMQARTQRGEDMRNYFLEVERIAQEAITPQITVAKLQELESKLHRLESLTVSSCVSDYSIMGYARLCNKRICLNEANALGRIATKKCKEIGLFIGSIRDSRYGLVNTYPEHILEDVFRDFFKRPRF